MTSFLEAALQLASRDWPVFPLKARGKTPLTKHGLKDATTDPAQIEQWWTKWPNANIGIAPSDGVAILDVDPRHGGDKVLQVLEEEHGTLPETFSVRSGSGGTHHYFLTNGTRLKNSEGKIGSGLDIKTIGGYVLAPPSIHPTGKPYEWLNDAPIAPLPKWIAEKLRQSQPPKTAANDQAKIPHGQHDKELTRIAGKLRHDGLEENAIAAALIEICEKRCEGYGSDYQQMCAKIAKSVCRYPVGVETQAPRSETGAAEETKPEHATDTGNAEYFTARHGEELRYDHRRGRWLLWHGHHWKPDADAEVRRHAKASMRQRFKDAAAIEDPDARGRAAKWAIGSESRARLDALIYLAQAERPIADAGTNWDTDPYLLGVPNGVINLRTGDLRAGKPEDRITMQSDVPYDLKASCERWERFLREIFDSNELIDFIQRAAGYSLTGTTIEQCLFLLYGRGANGKGTFANTLNSVLGDYGWNMPFATIEMRDRAAIPNDLAALVGRRFVIASETNDGTRLNESRIKALTGCDPITARFLHKEFFEFEPVAKFWLSVNHKPIVRDDSHGFWRRIRLIPFLKTFEVNSKLSDELRAEAAGILAWAVRGCLLWQQKGLAPPACVIQATDQYEKDSDPLAPFVTEACDLGPGNMVRALELFEHYKRWATRAGMGEKERLSLTMFGRKMEERYRRNEDEKGRFYEGISTRRMEV